MRDTRIRKKLTAILTAIFLVAAAFIYLLGRGHISDDISRYKIPGKEIEKGRVRLNSCDYAGSLPIYKGTEGKEASVWFPLSEVGKALGLSTKEGLSKLSVDFSVENQEFHYSFIEGELKRNPASLDFEMREPVLYIYGSVYISQEFLEKYLDCWIIDYRDRNNTYYISNDHENGSRFRYDWIKAGNIAHALGGIDDIRYSNSKEAFLYSYDKGFKVFEVDLNRTTDGTIGLAHAFGYLYGSEKNDRLKANGTIINWTAHRFMATKFRGRFKTITAGDLASLLTLYPDTYLVLDVKEGKEYTREVIETALEAMAPRNPTLPDRMIPQFYTVDDYADLKELYPWKSALYSLYKTRNENVDDAIAAAKKLGIRVVAYNDDKLELALEEKLLDLGIYPYYYTSNDPEETLYLKGRGVYGFYTDFLEP